MPLKSNTDEVLSILGYGRWQIPFLLLVVLLHLYIPIHIVGSTLLSVPLPFQCFSSPTDETINVTSTSTTNQPPAANYDSVCEPANQTELPAPPSAHETTLSSCPVLEYDPSKSSNTVISEFDLVCERSVLRPLFQMCIPMGMLFGNLLGGVISDKYGRKTVVIAGSVLSAAGVMALAACPWYLGVLVCRLILGMTVAFTFFPSYSLAQEVTPSRMRSQSGMLVGVGFGVGYVLMAGVGYFVRSWRHLLLIMASTLLLIIPLACLVDESPRWLAQRGFRKKAADSLERAAQRNRVSMTPELIAALDNLRSEIPEVDEGAAEMGVEGEGVCASLSQCFGQCRNYLSYPGLRLILLVSPAMWYLQNLVYMGLTLNANNFTSNDPFMYVAVSGAVDGASVLLATPLALLVGRRLLLTILYSVASFLLFLDIAIPEELKWLKWVFVMTAFLTTSAAYQVQFIYTPELYPTVMRSRGFGLSSGAGSLGGMTAPLITDLLAQQAWWSVNLVCGTAGLLACLLVRLLPETRNMPLPETVQDVEKRRRDRETGDTKTEEPNGQRSEGEGEVKTE